MRYESPDCTEVIDAPTASQIDAVLRGTSLDYWRRGGSGEAALWGNDGKILSITQPEQGQFFMLLIHEWRVPYAGGSCESLIESEFGGNPFWIPRACLVGVDDAANIAKHFVEHQSPWPSITWSLWSELPLLENYPRE